MKIWSVQSKELIDLLQHQSILYADPERCNHSNAKPAYDRLFQVYNSLHNTDYVDFFWGLSELFMGNESLEKIKYSILEKIGGEQQSCRMIVLNIPDELILETDFYNFTDYIYAVTESDEEVCDVFSFETNDASSIREMLWESAFSKRVSEKQVIFPYIKKEYIKDVF